MKEKSPKKTPLKFDLEKIIANRKKVEKAAGIMARQIRRLIAEGDMMNAHSYSLLFSTIKNAWAELMADQIIIEARWIPDNDKRKLLKRDIKTKWKSLLKYSFSYSFGKKNPSGLHNIMDRETLLIYRFAENTADKLFEDMNLSGYIMKGEWETVTENNYLTVSGKKTEYLGSVNILRIRHEWNMLRTIMEMCYAITSRNYTGDNTYLEKLRRKLQSQRDNLRYRKYDSYIKQLQERRKRGMKKRYANNLLS